jgi:hypothetical protein
MSGLPIPGVIIQKEQWVQCENPNCGKWRRLPPGAPAVPEDAPWYCYLNPDIDRNTCSADEAEYDEHNEIVLNTEEEELAYNKMVRERLEASIAAATRRPSKGGGRGTRGRGRGRGRGRPPSSAGRSGRLTSSYSDAAGKRVSYAEEDDTTALCAGQSDDLKAGGGGPHITAKQLLKQCTRLLNNNGSWDDNNNNKNSSSSRSRRDSSSTDLQARVPPAEFWHGLGKYINTTTGEDGGADVACNAIDLATSLLYFNNMDDDDGGVDGGGGNKGGGKLRKDVGDLALLASMLVAAKGMMEVGGVGVGNGDEDEEEEEDIMADD